MADIVHTRVLERELIARGLVPDRCRLVEVRIEPNSALVIRYEVFVTSDKLGLFADALKASATRLTEDDERNKRALASNEA